MLQESFCGLLWVKSLKPPLILMLAAFSLLSLVFLKARRCLYFLLLPGPASRWSTHNAPAASWSKPQGWGDEKRVWVQWSREFRLGTHMSCSLWWLILRFFRKKQRPHRVLLSGNKTQTLKWQLSSHLVITWRVQNQEKGSCKAAFYSEEKGWGPNPTTGIGTLDILSEEKRQNVMHLNDQSPCSQSLDSKIHVTLTTYFTLMIAPSSGGKMLLLRNDQSFATDLYNQKMTYKFYTKGIWICPGTRNSLN